MGAPDAAPTIATSSFSCDTASKPISRGDAHNGVAPAGACLVVVVTVELERMGSRPRADPKLATGATDDVTRANAALALSAGTEAADGVETHTPPTRATGPRAGETTPKTGATTGASTGPNKAATGAKTRATGATTGLRTETNEAVTGARA